MLDRYYRELRKFSIRDLWTDENRKPLIGTPLGKKQMVLEGVIIREQYKMGKLIAYQGRYSDQPVLEYPDGTKEVLESLRMTNW